MNLGGRRKVPALLVGGVDEAAMMATAMSLQLGLAGAVSVRHAIDPARQLLTRTVSDVSGVLERKEISLVHACVSCAIREDIVPTLERLASQGRWSSIVACLPVAAEPVQICRVLARAPGNAPHVTIAAVLAALDGSGVVDDLLGDDLLAERGVATSDEDRRGVAEVACALVEYADVVCLTEEPDPQERTLLGVLARPRVPLVADPSLLDAPALVAGVHRHQAAEAWVADVRREPLPCVPGRGVWQLDLRSDRPFHPLRFQDELAILGGGPRRSRGCFWLPTRPDDVCVWAAAGGQASVGSTQQWGRDQPLTRIVVVGFDDDAGRLRGAFERSLLTDEEIRSRGRIWEESWDGLEPWLGPIHRAA